MYTLVSAIAKPKARNSRWVNLNITNLTLLSLYRDYSQVIARLTNSFLQNEISLNLDAIRAQAATLATPFSQWLTALGNASLPTTNQLFELNTRYVGYADAFHAGYSATPVKAGNNAPGNELPSERNWLKLTKPGVNYADFDRYCLANVNGFFFRSGSSGQGVFVRDGNQSALSSGKSQVGIVSFKNLGAIKVIPITTGMVYKQRPAQSLRYRAYVNLGEDVSNKSLALVLGGYLHMLDQTMFWRVSDRHIGIDMTRFPLLDRYYQSRDYIDLSSLGLHSTVSNDSQIAPSEFFGDAALLAYLTLSQSYFVTIDNNDVFTERAYVEKTKVPDLYIAREAPIYPLMVDAGKIVPYWYTSEDGQYALTCTDSMRQNRLYDTIESGLAQSVSAARIPMNPEENSDAFFFKIGTQLA